MTPDERLERDLGTQVFGVRGDAPSNGIMSGGQGSALEFVAAGRVVVGHACTTVTSRREVVHWGHAKPEPDSDDELFGPHG